MRPVQMRGGMSASECIAMLASVTRLLPRASAQAYLQHQGIPLPSPQAAGPSAEAASTAPATAPVQTGSQPAVEGSSSSSSSQPPRSGVDPVMHELNAEDVLQAQMADLDQWDTSVIEAAAHGESLYSIASQGPSYSDSRAQRLAEDGVHPGQQTGEREGSYASMLGRQPAGSTAKRKATSGASAGAASAAESFVRSADSAGSRPRAPAKQAERADKPGRDAGAGPPHGAEPSLYSSSTQQLRERVAALRNPSRQHVRAPCWHDSVQGFMRKGHHACMHHRRSTLDTYMHVSYIQLGQGLVNWLDALTAAAVTLLRGIAAFVMGGDRHAQDEQQVISNGTRSASVNGPAGTADAKVDATPESRSPASTSTNGKSPVDGAEAQASDTEDPVLQEVLPDGYQLPPDAGQPVRTGLTQIWSAPERSS